MRITPRKKFLTLPINTLTSMKKVSFYHAETNQLVFDLDCAIDAISPNFTAYIDVSRFRGIPLDITVDPQMNFELRECDKQPNDVYNVPFRPQVHFTVKNGWNNDPNGLIKFQGKYHMFYQYNPCSAQWGNMHWGHAISEDLLHWNELDTALFPDENGTMYSGSAIEDKEALTKLGRGNSPKMLLYYTAASNNLLSKGKRYTQRLAYSEDGVNFEKFNEFPMIDHIESGNRDPKVVWAEELKSYLLALYLEDHRFVLFRSEDLLHWHEHQRLSLPSDRECPDLYPIYCENEKLWVFCGANDKYVIGRFENEMFTAITDERTLSCSPMNYAAQSFSGIDDGRVIRIYWQRASIPSPSFTQQMSIPVQMSVKKTNGEYYLHAEPIDEFVSLRKDKLSFSKEELSKGLNIELELQPLDIEFELSYNENAAVNLRIYGRNITIDMKRDLVICGKHKMPLSLNKDKAKLRIIVDSCTVEIFADDGRYLLSDMFINDPNLPKIIINSNIPLQTEKLDIYTLESIH